MQHSGLYPLLYPEVCLGTSRCDVGLFAATRGCIYENVLMFSQMSLKQSLWDDFTKKR